MAPASPRPALTEAEGAAWSGFLRAHTLITRQLDADLRAAAGLALSEFEILLHLAFAGGERRMAQIAEDVLLTGGGVTRIVTRLERLGLIERRACPKDGRGIFAVLTEKGWAVERAAHKVHIEGVRRLFLDGASGPDLKTLGRCFGKMADRARSVGDGADEACALDGSGPGGARAKGRKKAPIPRRS